MPGGPTRESLSTEGLSKESKTRLVPKGAFFYTTLQDLTCCSNRRMSWPLQRGRVEQAGQGRTTATGRDKVVKAKGVLVPEVRSPKSPWPGLEAGGGGRCGSTPWLEKKRTCTLGAQQSTPKWPFLGAGGREALQGEHGPPCWGAAGCQHCPG